MEERQKNISEDEDEANRKCEVCGLEYSCSDRNNEKESSLPFL